MDKSKNFNEEYGELELCACKTGATSELSGDFSLPDYQPEIKRLLRVTASMLPPSKYFGAGEATFTGNIDYYVLYMGSDNEIYCAPLTGEYNIELPISKEDHIDLGDELLSVTQITPELVSGRVTSPRHITLKCRLGTRARIYGKSRAMSNITKCDGTVEKLRAEVKNSSVITGVGEMINLTDEVMPDSRDGEFRVVCADGKVLINEVSTGRDEAICRGELYLKMLISRESGGMPSVVMRRIPFSSIISCEGVTPDATAYAKGTLSELTLTVDEGRVSIDAGVLLEAVCQQNSTVSYIADAYSVDSESECVRKEVILPRGVCAFNRNFTFSDSVEASDAGISEGLSVMDCCGGAYVDVISFDGGKCKMTGRCRFNLQMLDGSEYSSSEIEMPFKYEMDIPETQGELECEAEASVIFCRARMDGDRIGVDAEVAVCGRVWENKKCSVLEDFSIGEKTSARTGDINVYYPDNSDSLWSVAKKYNAPILALSENNKLPQASSSDSAQSLEGVEYLII